MPKTLPPHPGAKYTTRKTGQNLLDSINRAPTAEYTPGNVATDTTLNSGKTISRSTVRSAKPGTPSATFAVAASGQLLRLHGGGGN